jgi:glycine dehydrogenase subunit 1
MAWLGPRGFVEVGRRCVAKARYAADVLTSLPGVSLAFEAPFFKEFTIRLPRPAAEVRDALMDRGYLAGVPAAGHEDLLVVALTERRTRSEIDGLASAMGEVLAG